MTQLKYPTIASMEALHAQYGRPKSSNVIHNERLSPLEKIAIAVTQRIGTMKFFFVILLWTGLWLGWNVFAPPQLRFDPYPGFVLWLFISNLIQIHLMPLIMVGQNIQGKHEQVRAENDLKTDMKAEKEIETILMHLENQQELTLHLIKRIETLESLLKK